MNMLMGPIQMLDDHELMVLEWIKAQLLQEAFGCR
jgi:hypothetical protein